MDPIRIIDDIYAGHPETRKLLIRHSRNVAGLALQLAARNSRLGLNKRFLEDAAMLHDIGILHTDAPDLGCFGNLPYLAHGYMGRAMLEDIGLPEHALVCERHVGCGITVEEIRRYSLPLPEREMLPISMEERLVCYADKFFSKTSSVEPDRMTDMQTLIRRLSRFGEDQVRRFMELRDLFDPSSESSVPNPQA